MNDQEIVLAHMRVGVARLKLMQSRIEEVGVVLGAGRISAQGAVHWLWDNGVLDLCLTTGEIEGVLADKDAAA